MSKNRWFEVDKEGLAQLLERRGGPAFVVLELLSNAWDEAASTVAVTLTRAPGRPLTHQLKVEDDSPEGFRDLAHAFTLFAPSGKKANPEQRGRFNLGEKMVLALCREASITSTKGTVVFSEDGSRGRALLRRPQGTAFEALLRMSRLDAARALSLLRTTIPPAGVRTIINGTELPAREPAAVWQGSLPTEVAGEDGILRRTSRKTTLRLYRPLPCEKPMLYEMGIPVVESETPFHVDVQQRVPLNLERENVTPAFRRAVHAACLDAAAEQLEEEEAAGGWVADALPGVTSDAAVERVITARFGSGAVAFDPSCPEASREAAAAGVTVVHGGAFPRGAWERIRAADALPSASKRFPVGIPTSPDGIPPIPRRDWTLAMERVELYTRVLGYDLLGFEPAVEFAVHPRGIPGGCSAWWGTRTITFNLGRLGRSWPERATQLDLDELLIHEFAHHAVADHLTHAFHRECCRLGARARQSEARLFLVYPGREKDRA